MQDIAKTVGAILGRHAGLASAIEPSMRLDQLGIDRLDLDLIMLDLEDALGVAVVLEDADEPIATAGDVIGRAEAAVERHAAEIHRRRAMPRIKRTWLDTGAEQRG